MKPYYSDKFCTIFNCDCREILPELPKVDLVLTDPVWPGASVPLAGYENPVMLFEQTSELIRCTRWAVQIGCDTDPDFLKCLRVRWPFFRVCWLEIVRPHYKGRLMYGSDVAYLYGTPPPSREGHHVIPGKCLCSSSSGKESDHPCPRKLTHVRWLCDKWSSPDETILDPFMGSGTTLVAAKQMQRQAIGIEIEERYCQIAADRLRQGVLELY